MAMTSFKPRNFAAALLSAGALIVTSTFGFAQSTEGAAEGAISSAPNQPGWLKICNKDQNDKSVCAINYEVRSQTGQTLAAASIVEQEGQKRRQLRVLVPVGMLLQAGLRLQIDKGKQLAMKYDICLPNGCFSSVNVDQSFINQLKRGGEVTITVANQRGNQVPYKMSLDGFTKTYDGEPLDPQTIQQNQQSLQEQLQKKAEEARKKLLEEKAN